MSDSHKKIAFALVVQAPPSRSTAALEFATAALVAGHKIPRVFFLREGSETARAGDAAFRWAALARQYSVELSVCVSGAARRNLYDEVSAREHAAAANVAPGFSIAGLGLMVDAIANADRVMTFL